MAKVVLEEGESMAKQGMCRMDNMCVCVCFSWTCLPHRVDHLFDRHPSDLFELCGFTVAPLKIGHVPHLTVPHR